MATGQGEVGAGERPLRVIIAGGYTGGHICCALAIARALEAAFPGVQLLLCGARGGMEVEAARAAGHAIETVWVSGIDRRRSLRALARNCLLPLQLLVSRLEARRILMRFGPDVVIGVGGYASGPVLAEAQRLHVPTLIHEANALPGIANRLLARRANVVCLGTPLAAARFGRARTVVTGNPVGAVAQAASVTPQAARVRLGLAADRRTLLVTGGSLGAARLNQWVLGQRGRFDEHGFQVLWQCGRRHFAACHARREEMGPGIHLRPFIADMALAYAASDLVVTAAGAFTVAELALLRKPAIIVPLRDVAEDHQAMNAAEMKRRGATVWDGDDDRSLLDNVVNLAGDPTALAAAGARLGALAWPDAADRIVTEVARLLGPRGGLVMGARSTLAAEATAWPG